MVMGMPHERCKTCNLPIPTEKVSPFSIPCSEGHIRCLRCGWPVAKEMIEVDEVCDICRGKKV